MWIFATVSNYIRHHYSYSSTVEYTDSICLHLIPPQHNDVMGGGIGVTLSIRFDVVGSKRYHKINCIIASFANFIFKKILFLLVGYLDGVLKVLCTLSAIPSPLLGNQHVQSTIKKSIMSKSVPSLVKRCNKLNQLWWLKLSIYIPGSGATLISEIDSVIPICLFCGISGAQPIPYLTSWIRYVIHNISYDNNNKKIYLSIRDNF